MVFATPSAIPKAGVSLIGLCVTLDVSVGVNEQQQQYRRFEETRETQILLDDHLGEISTTSVLVHHPSLNDV